ncbi:Xaa-Pro peptidase family protein [Patulibacter defluvii]|uniref:Xaa-Pro peptidase family protein n=1 Tax=Patulibacter defluvii TaxID=3095358 RepID=UPI002A74C6FC|nr:Xaa-Pro peptidase family protein [Patulibacter sp. DM4]
MSGPPFPPEQLDRLLAEQDVAAVLATSAHNVRHLLGGYRFFLYATLDGIGHDRYLPFVGYVAGRPEAAFYVGAGNEAWGTDATPLWVPDLALEAWTAADAARIAGARLRDAGLARGRIGVELPYLTADAFTALRDALPHADLVDVSHPLEELRAVKRRDELDLMRRGATAVVDAMLATFAATRVGASEREIVERLRIEETRRGLGFGYCLIASGDSATRGPSDRRLAPGDVLSLDSGAHFDGYVADLTRMAVAGEPTRRHQQLLDQILAVQEAARDAARGGRRGGAIFDAADAAIREQADGARMTFLAHGTGLLSHEAPRLTDSGSPPYPATHRERPLRPGQVLSIETHLIDPLIGFVKLEDTVIVTAGACEPCGDHGRGWTVIDA